MSKLNDLFLEKIYESSGYATKDYIKKILKEDHSSTKMITFKLEIANPDYEWGKGYINDMTSEKFHSNIQKMVNKITFLNMENDKKVIFKSLDWIKNDSINGFSSISFHPMTWTVKIPVSKLEEFFEEINLKPYNIAYVIVTRVADLIEFKNEINIVKYFDKAMNELFESEIKAMRSEMSYAKKAKWRVISGHDRFTHYLENKATDFFESKRRMKKEEIEEYTKIIDEAAKRGFKFYKEEFLKLPFIESKTENGLSHYKLKPLSKRKIMSTENKKIAKSYCIDC